jgi:hypothetical protein
MCGLASSHPARDVETLVTSLFVGAGSSQGCHLSVLCPRTPDHFSLNCHPLSEGSKRDVRCWQADTTLARPWCLIMSKMRTIDRIMQIVCHNSMVVCMYLVWIPRLPSSSLAAMCTPEQQCQIYARVGRPDLHSLSD